MSLCALLFQTLWFDLQQRLSDEEGTNMVRAPSPKASLSFSCGLIPAWARTQDAGGLMALPPGTTMKRCSPSTGHPPLLGVFFTTPGL